MTRRDLARVTASGRRAGRRSINRGLVSHTTLLSYGADAARKGESTTRAARPTPRGESRHHPTSRPSVSWRRPRCQSERDSLRQAAMHVQPADAIRNGSRGTAVGDMPHGITAPDECRAANYRGKRGATACRSEIARMRRGRRRSVRRRECEELRRTHPADPNSVLGSSLLTSIPNEDRFPALHSRAHGGMATGQIWTRAVQPPGAGAPYARLKRCAVRWACRRPNRRPAAATL